MAQEFEHLKRPCPGECPWTGSEDCAQCNDYERFIRHYMHGPALSPMTEAEREWCIEEADHAGECSYPREATAGLNDQELAKSTYGAWREYVQCNCM